MGDEIERRYFDAEDFSEFRQRLDAETVLLEQQFAREEFSERGDVAGFELEAWLVDQQGDPLPCNDDYLAALDNPLVVPELAAFNVELNGSPSALTGRVFTRLHDELGATWSACREGAQRTGCHLVAVGILPTVREAMLTSEHMSSMVRYHSLNDRIMALRDGKPLDLSIEGDPDLSITHHDVMLEAATTSFQIHLQCKPERSVRDFNASIIASAPMVAASANSPLLFGHTLWDETRIPLFEQAVNIGSLYPSRVSFGSGYVQQSLLEIFKENQRDHLILIPAVRDDPPSKYAHVRFHNGTLWRWNRPLIGFDYDGIPHLRIEHRVVPGGPTIADVIANAALFFGLIEALIVLDDDPGDRLDFAIARDNFYAAAHNSLDATVTWFDGGRGPMHALLRERLLPLARDGLERLAMDRADIDRYLGIIARRLETGQTGAAWQRRWIESHGRDFAAMTLAYYRNAETGSPVHEWLV